MTLLKRVIINKIRLDIHNPESNKTVILNHGFLSNKNRSLFLSLARGLSKAGMKVVRFNYHTESISERLNRLNSVINYFKKDRIGLMGTSMGGMISILTAHHRRVKALALVNTLYDLKDAYNNYLKVKPLTKSLLRIVNKELFNYNLKRVITKLRKPTIIISGDKDRIIPTTVMKKLYLDLKGDKKIVVLRQCSHTVWKRNHLIRTTEEIRDWFKKYLS